MNSHEKVRAALDRAEGWGDDPNAPATVRAMATGLSMFRGQLEGMLPASSSDLDELLYKGAGWLLSLRSDEAGQMIVSDSAEFAGE